MREDANPLAGVPRPAPRPKSPAMRRETTQDSRLEDESSQQPAVDSSWTCASLAFWAPGGACRCRAICVPGMPAVSALPVRMCWHFVEGRGQYYERVCGVLLLHVQVVQKQQKGSPQKDGWLANTGVVCAGHTF